MASDTQKAKSVLWYHESKSMVEVQKRFGTEFGRECPLPPPNFHIQVVVQWGYFTKREPHPTPSKRRTGRWSWGEFWAPFVRVPRILKLAAWRAEDTANSCEIVKVPQPPVATSDIASKTSSMEYIRCA